jgi:hypothetical protein
MDPGEFIKVGALCNPRKVVRKANGKPGPGQWSIAVSSNRRPIPWPRALITWDEPAQLRGVRVVAIDYDPAEFGRPPSVARCF